MTKEQKLDFEYYLNRNIEGSNILYHVLDTKDISKVLSSYEVERYKESCIIYKEFTTLLVFDDTPEMSVKYRLSRLKEIETLIGNLMYLIRTVYDY